MNPLAKSLNEVLEANNPCILEMLSSTGKKMFMPKGILSQSAEAKEKATKFNATIGISTAKGEPMYLESMFKRFQGIHPKKLFTYAPATGLPELRELWAKKIRTENPSLKDVQMSNPVVCNALTNGLVTAGELFLDKGEFVVLPDKFWGNYRLMFNTLIGGEIATYETFNENNGYNVEGLLKTVKECGMKNKKVFVVLNFPNNPTGYTLTKDEAVRLSDGLVEIAESGINIVAVTDDAYFGLFFDDVFKESLFSLLAGRSKRLLAVKIDGITKESFAWGFRVGFITFGQTIDGDNSAIFKALETKAAGYLRATISSAPHPSQSITVDVLKEPSFKFERGELNAVIEERCKKVKAIFDKGLYADEFTPYPFNSGYFMCIRLKNVEAETLRTALLDKYGVGVISTNQTDIRIAFSSVDVENIDELYSIIYQCCKELHN
ncbi:MAG TPA: aminotransferase class I/II-fold pyridoxal phosphate-dependent enzyme [Candidatus Mucispirillum faecigallinarum]|uniref:Aminotransferase class I/II-fold pyridoxal phosphate-dependent enzyme n=1 Tax=Candidatus Mucispirillum faecigallinarum TaxID=2838699 RepID=A0A9D2GTV7_9BACT|nr:aminotransferase class I/II-fold pyridoxal phosphate-dependent enzyme [Candidatus Mucispirillum faecigallinarum]